MPGKFFLGDDKMKNRFLFLEALLQIGFPISNKYWTKLCKFLLVGMVVVETD